MHDLSADTIKGRYRLILETIDERRIRCGLNQHVRVMAVTKGFPVAVAVTAEEAGINLFGENRVQEAVVKYGRTTPAGELHLIGHLQTNKAKKAAGLFACVQSIDKYETAFELNRHAQILGKPLAILMQLNTSHEESKFGYPDRQSLLADLEMIASLDSLVVTGLMTIGPFINDEQAIRRCFGEARTLFEEIRSWRRFPEWGVLSMGMSHDFGIAVEEGATMVRIGTALFGERNR